MSKMTEKQANSVDDHEARIKSIIYGNAIGDAIGLLTEFMRKEEAKTYYGDKEELEFDMKVPDMHRARWKTGDWTDDTDQMILIMLSILDQNGKVSAVDFASKLLGWKNKGFPELGDYGGMGIGSTTVHVLRHDKFLTDPHFAAEDIWKKTGCHVAPNGGLMRTAILGVLQYQNIDNVIRNTLEICKVTHFDPRCQASCIAMTTTIALMLQKNPRHFKTDGSLDLEGIIKESYKLAKKCVSERSHKRELKKYLFARSLSSLCLSEKDSIGYTYKCLGAGFWALRQNDFRSALQKLLMEGGDADTNGAVAGALLGCKVGIEALPTSWVNGLLHKEWLDKIIAQFIELAKNDIPPAEER